MNKLLEFKNIFNIFSYLDNSVNKKPDAKAVVKGSKNYSKINGTVEFFQTKYGTIVKAKIKGLPDNKEKCKSPLFAFHIHSGSKCSGNAEDPFADALTHYNPDNCNHPYHAGDMPPLFGNDGYAYMTFLTNRFSVDEIIGKTVIIHINPDDFMTQPSGNAGMKIACGIIKKV